MTHRRMLAPAIQESGDATSMEEFVAGVAEPRDALVEAAASPPRRLGR